MIIERASKILPDILRLRDVIYRDLPHAYNEAGGNFAGLKTMSVTKDDETPRPLRFLEEFTEFNYPDGFIYPILAGFRKYIDHRGEWSWKEGVDPLKIWEEKKCDVASAIKDAVGAFQNVNKMGKAGATWRMCYDAL